MAARAGPLVNLNYVLTTGGLTGVTRDIERSNMRMINSFRWLGRDIIRVGAIIQSFGNMIGRAWNFIAKRSDTVAGFLEDVDWAFEDIANILGDALAPILDHLVTYIIEPLVEGFESLSDEGKTFIALLLFGIPVITRVIGAFTKFRGTLMMLRGTQAGYQQMIPSFADELKGVIRPTATLTGNAIQYARSIKEQTIRAENLRGVYQAILPDFNKNSTAQGIINTEMKSLSNTIASNEVRLAALAKQLGISNSQLEAEIKDVKADVKQKKVLGGVVGKIVGGFKALGKSLLYAGISMLIFTAAFTIFEPLGEPFMNLINLIAEALEPWIEQIAEWIEGFTEWLEMNPEILKYLGMIVAALGLFIVAKKAGGWLKGLLGGLFKFIPGAGGASTGAGSMGKSFLMVALGIAALVASFGALIYLIGISGLSFDEVTGIFWELTKVIGVLVGVMIAAGVAAFFVAPGFTALFPVLLGLSALVLALGLGMLLAGYGFKAAAEGVDIASAAIKDLLGEHARILALSLSIFALAGAFGALGLAGLGIGLASLAIGALALSLEGLAIAISHLALSTATLEQVGGIGAAIVGKLGEIFGIPRLQEGGEIRRGGVAYLEPAEVVTPARGGAGLPPANVYNYFTIEATIRDTTDIDEIVRRVKESLTESYRSISYG